MPSTAHTDDQETPQHERIMAAGMAMAATSTVPAFRDALGRPERKELTRVWVEFMTNLAALGVPIPTTTKAAGK